MDARCWLSDVYIDIERVYNGTSACEVLVMKPIVRYARELVELSRPRERGQEISRGRLAGIAQHPQRVRFERRAQVQCNV